MKSILPALLIGVALITFGCKEKHDGHDHGSEASDPENISENEALYNEVMKVHNEVMPKLEDIYNKKESLNDSIASNPKMTEADKEAIQLQVARLDSADKSMMTWMHEFNPLPDSTGEERAREYLENEMEKIKKVRENIEEVLKEN
jgi:hypothetical protein